MVKCLTQVLRMVDALKALHEHVINVYFHGTSNMFFEELVDHLLEGCFSVFQSERQYFVTVDSSILMNVVLSLFSGCILI